MIKKTINIVQAQDKTPFANNNAKFSVTLPVNSIEFYPEFKSLFTIDDDVLERISNSIKEDKFDMSQPVHIWKFEDQDKTHLYLIDGHTRLAAAKEAGLETIPCYEHHFETFEEAYKYALKLQVNRRNLSSQDLFKNISKLYGSDFVQKTENKTETIAGLLGVSNSTVERALRVENSDNEELKAAVESGELTINQATKKIAQQKKQERESAKEKPSSEEETDEISDGLSDNSGVPAGLNFSHSDGYERPVIPPAGIEDDNPSDALIKARREGFLDGEKEGFAEGFSKALMFVLYAVSKGKTPEEIYKDERISDLSPSELSGFVLEKEAEDYFYSLDD